MDSDIQFGEVEELRPEQRRRPDRDRHFAVCTCGSPDQRDLPIFIELDVLAEIETHAGSDPDVELGGVLLGGQFEDQDGNPFVLVLDSLRAEHYESSGSHFKFTHDTWTQISRQRDEFSDDLLMVGWYHTHPNLGVFLSGMDRFICKNFFNRPLDVALVLDPVRGDRGWFYWGGGEKLPRAGGFAVIASRFRRRDLQMYVELLQEGTAMTTKRLPGATPQLPPQQVIHTIRPQLGWVGAALMAMLVLQVCTTLLLALRIGAPASSELDVREQRLAAREEVFQDLLGQVKVGPEGKLDLKSLVEQNEDLRRRADRLAKTDLLLDEAAQWIDKERKDLQAKLQESKQELAARNQESLNEIGELEAHKRAADKEIAQLKEQLAEATGDDLEQQPATGTWTWTYTIAAAVGLLVIGVLAALMIRRTVRRRRLS